MGQLRWASLLSLFVVMASSHWHMVSSPRRYAIELEGRDNELRNMPWVIIDVIELRQQWQPLWHSSCSVLAADARIHYESKVHTNPLPASASSEVLQLRNSGDCFHIVAATSIHFSLNTLRTPNQAILYPDLDKLTNRLTDVIPPPLITTIPYV